MELPKSQTKKNDKAKTIYSIDERLIANLDYQMYHFVFVNFYGRKLLAKLFVCVFGWLELMNTKIENRKWSQLSSFRYRFVIRTRLKSLFLLKSRLLHLMF